MKKIILIVGIAMCICTDAGAQIRTTRTTTTRTLQQRRTDLRRADTMGQYRRYNNIQRRQMPASYQPVNSYTPGAGTLPGSTNNTNINRNNSLDSVGNYRNRP